MLCCGSVQKAALFACLMAAVAATAFVIIRNGQHSASSTELLPNHLGALQGTDSVNHGFLFCHSLTPALAAGFGVNKLSVDRHLEISGHPSVTLLSEGHFLALELLFQELLEGRGKSAIPSAAAILDVDLQAHAVQKIEV